MLRAASKNFQDVAVLTSPEDYEPVLKALKAGNGVLSHATLSRSQRRRSSARLDTMLRISQYLSRIESGDGGFQMPSGGTFRPKSSWISKRLPTCVMAKIHINRRRFTSGAASRAQDFAAARQLQGKELSYNNIVDLEAAWNLLQEFDAPACCIIKHTNPCGTAIGSSLREAYMKAFEADTVSAFGLDHCSESRSMARPLPK